MLGIAHVTVHVDNKDTWKWFITLLYQNNTENMVGTICQTCKRKEFIFAGRILICFYTL